jgi:hypothetical protein
VAPIENADGSPPSSSIANIHRIRVAKGADAAGGVRSKVLDAFHTFQSNPAGVSQI